VEFRNTSPLSVALNASNAMDLRQHDKAVVILDTNMAFIRIQAMSPGLGPVIDEIRARIAHGERP